MRDYLLPFVGAFVVCAGVFLAMDYAVMAMQGLDLIFKP
jgi:hypothetical protein